MPIQKLREFLDEKGVPYECIDHPATFTAQETAEATHTKGREMAKTVIVKADGKLRMVVLPAPDHLDLDKFRKETGAKDVRLAEESEWADLFPNCETGAMPPFGNLYGMDVYVHADLDEDPDITFNAGTHKQVIRMQYKDFADLVNPALGDFAQEE